MAESSPLAQYASRLSQSPRTARAGSECTATFPMYAVPLEIFLQIVVIKPFEEMTMSEPR
ncbi:unnamed protein product, partial [Symbiodinium necroappetens]